MNIGIIVYSQTGNTYSVASKLNNKLSEKGHTVNIERITTMGKEKTPDKIQLQKVPDISIYDSLVLCGPVHAFSLCPALRSCLKQKPSFTGKKITGFVTMQLPYTWMGGKRAIAQMKKICISKGGKVYKTGIINWSKKDREKKIEEMTEEFSKLF